MAEEKNPNEHQGNDNFIFLAHLLRDIFFCLFFELDQLCIFLFFFFSSFLKQKRKSSFMAIYSYGFPSGHVWM